MSTSARSPVDLDGLPGADRVRKGLEDRAAGRRTVEALLVSVATGRLRDLGLEPAVWEHRLPADGAELALYAAICESGCDDPYSRYNALLRELSSFLEAASLRRSRARGAS